MKKRITTRRIEGTSDIPFVVAVDILSSTMALSLLPSLLASVQMQTSVLSSAFCSDDLLGLQTQNA